MNQLKIKKNITLQQFSGLFFQRLIFDIKKNTDELGYHALKTSCIFGEIEVSSGGHFEFLTRCEFNFR